MVYTSIATLMAAKAYKLLAARLRLFWSLCSDPTMVKASISWPSSTCSLGCIINCSSDCIDSPTDTYDGYLDPRFTWLGTDSYYQQGPILCVNIIPLSEPCFWYSRENKLS
jgi:hypothetical protein